MTRRVLSLDFSWAQYFFQCLGTPSNKVCPEFEASFYYAYHGMVTIQFYKFRSKICKYKILSQDVSIFLCFR